MRGEAPKRTEIVYQIGSGWSMDFLVKRKDDRDVKKLYKLIYPTWEMLVKNGEIHRSSILREYVPVKKWKKKKGKRGRRKNASNG